MHLSAKLLSRPFVRPLQVAVATALVVATGVALAAPRPVQRVKPVPDLAAQPAAPLGNTAQVGRLSIPWCPEVHTYCGHFKRPFDPAGVVPGDIGIYFEYYPRRDQHHPSKGMLVAVEGGPGYPSTGSRGLYIPLYGPLMNERELVLMDNRGTGRSQVIDCAVQRRPELTEWNIAECGRQLGATAPLYSGLLASDDLAALLQALGAPRVDLYGDSYGTYFSQTFAYRHPQWLRSIVLDSAYPVPQVGGETPWYPTFLPAMRDKFNLVCARSPGCRDLPGSSMDHIQPALDRLREAPFAAQARDADGVLRSFTADASQLATMMVAAAPPVATARETDAAARAFAAGDTAPLLRLMAETGVASDSRRVGRRYFSTGAYLAVNCQDVAQIYDMRLPPPARRRQRDHAMAEQERRQPDLYAPFTISEFRAVPLDLSLLDACVAWPSPPPEHPPGPHVPPHPAMPDVPVLVLAAELDDITTPAEGRIVASLFPQSEYVLAANSFHVAAGPTLFDPCIAQITRRFIETLSPGDTRCAARIAPLRTPPTFARHVDELAAAEALPGNRASVAELRAVTAAVQTLGDALGRLETNTSGTSVGLRGGTFNIENKGAHLLLRFDRVRWAEDLAVSGTLRWAASQAPAEADISFTGPGGRSGQLRVRWTELQPEALAQVDGTVGGHRVVARTPAP
jgi:pimeloyl-ACP methyl ester carboxylesterase